MNLPKDLLNKYEFIDGDGAVFVIYKAKNDMLRYEASFKQNAIIFVKEGIKSVHTKNANFSIHSGEVLFIPSATHTLSDIAINQRYESHILFFSDDLLIKLCQKYKINFTKKPSKKEHIFSISKDEILGEIFLSLDLYMRNQSKSKELVNLKFEELFLYLISSKNATFEAYLSHLRKLNSLEFKAVFSSEIQYESVIEMAKVAKMDASSFSRKFRAIFGTSPKEWIDEKRFQMASYYVKNSDKNINQICIECGFNSPAWFIARFKKRYGTTPYRLKKSNNLYNLS